MELHLSAITDHVAKENHTIDWEGVKFPARDTDWTARWVKEAVEIRKTGAHTMNRDRGHNHLPSLYSKLLVKKTSPRHHRHKWQSTSALMMPIVIVRQN